MIEMGGGGGGGGGCNRVYNIHVSGHDPLTFSFLSFILFDWVGGLWPQLSKVLKPVRWAGLGNEKADRAAKRRAKGVDSSTVTMKIGLADVYAELTKQAWKKHSSGAV